MIDHHTHETDTQSCPVAGCVLFVHFDMPDRVTPHLFNVEHGTVAKAFNIDRFKPSVDDPGVRMWLDAAHNAMSYYEAQR